MDDEPHDSILIGFSTGNRATSHTAYTYGDSMKRPSLFARVVRALAALRRR